MNNLLQSLRGALSALIGFQSPEDGLLEEARRRWNEGRTDRPSLLDEAWEERVMFAVRLSPMDDPNVPDWLGRRLPPPAVGGRCWRSASGPLRWRMPSLSSVR